MTEGYRPIGDKKQTKREAARDKPPAKANPLDAGDGLLDLAQISKDAIPVRQWLVPDIIPMANVTQLSGDGGLGKSLLALQLAACCALNLPWLGVDVRQCRSLIVFCEDDADEITRRLYEITAAYGYRIEDLVEHVDIVTRVGEENALMTFHKWGEELPKPTPFFDKIHATMVRDDYGLVIMDSSHDLFIGNENDRTQVRQFVGCLRQLSRINDAAVLLNSHPSVTGMNSGTGSSGSTAWNNAVRSRIYLTRPEGSTDKRLRVLKTMKANYALGDTELALMWENGIMVPSDLVGTTDKAQRQMQTGQALPMMVAKVQEFCEQGIYLSPHDNHPKDYIVRRLLECPEFRGYEKGGMTALVQRAVKEKQLEVIVIPRKRRGQYRQVMVPFGFRPPQQSRIDFDNAALANAYPTQEEIDQARAEMETPAGQDVPPPASPEDYGTGPADDQD